MVEFVDGSVKAQLGIPDMKIPIQYAITYPHHSPAQWESLDLEKIPPLLFSENVCKAKLENSPVWVREPLLAYLKGGIPSEKSFSYIAASDKAGNLIVERK